jgi:signal transduction histidine kinase
MSSVSAADLRPIDLFDEVDDAGLERWAQAASLRQLQAGDTLVEQEEPGASVFMLLEGTLQALRHDGDRIEPLGLQHAPTWLGATAAMLDAPIGVSVQAQTDVRVAVIAPDTFRDLATSEASVHHKVMQAVRPLMSRMAAVEQNQERLTSLGTMAAGLAHELNNPAAAARRAAADMASALDVLSDVVGQFVEAGIERAEAEELVELQRQALASCKLRTPLDALDAADREDDLADALQTHGVADAHRLAAPLAAADLDGAWVARVATLAGSATPAALEWVAASLEARTLAADLADATERMSKLVGAVKSYAYMDRGDLVEADVHEGLETTLVVLNHKLKHTSIEVDREYDRSLPPLMMYGAELNQVWTNLIDNAIAALDESGTITVSTRRDGPCILVDIADDGPGIPEPLRERIFDPFFTTKAVGAGTGLGLDTARRIVEQRHHGSIAFDSSDQGTVFHVWLPLSGAG